MTAGRRRFALVLALAVAAVGCPAVALAQRPATPREFTAIKRLLGPSASSLHDSLEWVRVSTRGPFALAYLSGPQEATIVLRGAGTRWSDLDAISDEGLRCGMVPAAVIADLRLERYNDGPKPCDRT